MAALAVGKDVSTATRVDGLRRIYTRREKTEGGGEYKTTMAQRNSKNRDNLYNLLIYAGEDSAPM